MSVDRDIAGTALRAIVHPRIIGAIGRRARSAALHHVDARADDRGGDDLLQMDRVTEHERAEEEAEDRVEKKYAEARVASPFRSSQSQSIIPPTEATTTR